MRTLFGTLLIVFLVLLGIGLYLDWFSFSTRRDPQGKVDGVTLNVNRDRIEQDTSRVREGVRKAGEQVRQGAEEAAEHIRNPAQTVEGRVVSVNEGEARLTVRTADNRTVDLDTTASTRARRHEVEVLVGQLMEGDQVVVRYHEQNGRQVADTITVQPRR
ncbi:MAG: hypothetical protein L0Z62_31845 [Gemmataceae bacterium]|nr:hypothetical protein [Gemmataceae bacterium]